MAASSFETADRAVTGDVTVINIPWAFKDGKIDWLFNPTMLEGHGPVNNEWTWQLNRMSFWTEMYGSNQVCCGLAQDLVSYRPSAELTIRGACPQVEVTT